jgi:hypothetical protein
MITKQVLFSLFIFTFFLFSGQVFAHGSHADTSHTHTTAHTVIINQVRGSSCCDVGSAAFFENQVNTVQKLQLPATFTLRYDTLDDESFLQTINTASSEVTSFGGFLEVIPSLAEDAGVAYLAEDETWYEAQYAFLIGYSQQDRKKLIDTYMEKYFAVFEEYPRVTTAWMIDAWSLQYLKQEYGVLVHQITREQYGTDSYALYGGPAHYPYWPSENWAMIPSEVPSETMPLIVRQTITDPVQNYGDDSSFHTSQPNDYLQDSAQTIAYFKHLFAQAHNQPQYAPTFALLGLENSMDEIFQKEFEQQLEYVAGWQGYDSEKQVVSVAHFESWYRQNQMDPTPVRMYAGIDYFDETQLAWWMTTPHYRARVRKDGDRLYLTDLRIYDTSFTDPYLEQKAENLGWWIVPFSLDGSRFFVNQEDPEPNQLAQDNFTDRKQITGTPAHILISENAHNIRYEINDISTEVYFWDDDQIVALFTPEAFYLSKQAAQNNSHPWLDSVLDELRWFSDQQVRLWGFGRTEQDHLINFTPFATTDANSLQVEREKRYPLLFPELTVRDLNIEKSYLYTNNQYAIVGRNPVRLVLFPRDEYDMPTLLEAEPEVSTEDEISEITIKRQHGNSGMIFIDFESDRPLKTNASMYTSEFSSQQTIYFAPNCKQQIGYCITHPRQAFWYLRAVIDDRLRVAQEE